MTRRAPQAAPPAERVPSVAEKRLSWVLLSLLPIVAVAVYVKGRQFDPDLFALNPAALTASAPRTSSRPSALIAPAATGTTAAILANPEFPSAVASSTATSPSRGAAPALPQRLSNSWQADAPAEQFTADTLYQKIDGRADEYLKTGFLHLDTISYAHGSEFVDVFLYDMGTASHARAQFAAERPAAAALSSPDADSYCIAASCFFVQGRHYGQVIGSESTPEVEQAVHRAARDIAALVGERRP